MRWSQRVESLSCRISKAQQRLLLTRGGSRSWRNRVFTCRWGLICKRTVSPVCGRRPVHSQAHRVRAQLAYDGLCSDGGRASGVCLLQAHPQTLRLQLEGGPALRLRPPCAMNHTLNLHHVGVNCQVWQVSGITFFWEMLLNTKVHYQVGIMGGVRDHRPACWGGWRWCWLTRHLGNNAGQAAEGGGVCKQEQLRQLHARLADGGSTLPLAVARQLQRWLQTAGRVVCVVLQPAWARTGTRHGQALLGTAGHCQVRLDSSRRQQRENTVGGNLTTVSLPLSHLKQLVNPDVAAELVQQSKCSTLADAEASPVAACRMQGHH